MPVMIEKKGLTKGSVSEILNHVMINETLEEINLAMSALSKPWIITHCDIRNQKVIIIDYVKETISNNNTAEEQCLE